MRSISEMPKHVVAGIKTLFCDIDDTITTDGYLTADAYKAIEELNNRGITVAAITGRPAGWCDMLARFWPVKGVIGENGAFYYSYDRINCKMLRKLHPDVQQEVNRLDRFDKIKSRVLTEVQGAAIASDQAFRLADLAIDFCEDVPPLSQLDIERIKTIFEEEGATAKISSIHVNGWFGSYDKLTMTEIFAKEILELDINISNDRIIFVGDSPNDSPLFDFFENSCGVANIKEFEQILEAKPKWIANQRSGAGFCEIVNIILTSQQ